MLDVNICLSEAEEQMEMAIMHLEDEFAHIRAGKANIRILDDIRVDSYGSMVALNNVAALSTPDARTLGQEHDQGNREGYHRLCSRNHAHQQR